jgi:hypothetical protein
MSCLGEDELSWHKLPACVHCTLGAQQPIGMCASNQPVVQVQGSLAVQRVQASLTEILDGTIYSTAPAALAAMASCGQAVRQCLPQKVVRLHTVRQAGWLQRHSS